jgi:hypothetical protein
MGYPHCVPPTSDSPCRALGPFLAAAAVAASLTLTSLAQAQGQGQGQQAPTLADLALDWARGRFATPVICEFDGRPVRGIRRVLIGPGPKHVRPRVGKITFVDLDAKDASRCFTELSGDTPNLTGSLQFRVLGNWRPESAERDFRQQLRRRQGFEFEIPAGGLRMAEVGQPAKPVRRVDFRGGRAVLQEIAPGSDDARLLSDLRSPRKLLLEISARDGTKLSFPLYMTDLR